MMGRTLRWSGLLALSSDGCVVGFDGYHAVCEPRTEEACYGGPAGTNGVGRCKAGVHTCKPAGAGYGTCLDEAVPQVEQCDTLSVDENCDGEPTCTGAYLQGKGFGDPGLDYGAGASV